MNYIFLLNVHSMNNKNNDLELLLSARSGYTICLTETWLKQYQMETVQISNYKLSSYFSREMGEGGGSCIFSRDELSASMLELN